METIPERILRVLEKGPMTSKRLMEELGIEDRDHRSATMATLRRMRRQGRVIKLVTPFGALWEVPRERQ